MKKGRPAIIDEFTDLPMSRQLKCRRRWKRDGLCQQCGRPRAETSTCFCPKHLADCRERTRKRDGSKPWESSGIGRPPGEVLALRRLEREIQIIDILDPLCRRRYTEGECLPRGHECSTPEKVNQEQEWRERTARAKAKRIMALFKT